MKPNGIILVDKPIGPTSHDIVQIFRHILGMRQVGHMGTLDPLATGLLLLGFGEGTKLTPFLSDLDKCYTCTARLGARSSTDDAMGTIDPVADPEPIERAQVEEALTAFRGWIDQMPPAYSAIKVDGQALYKYARKGQEVERKPRRVRVHEIAIERFDPPDVAIRMRVSSGTYVRSIVRDLGENLAVGAYVTELRRTTVGPFDVSDAVCVTADGELAGDLEKSTRRLIDALPHLRRLIVPDELLAPVRNGSIVEAERLEFSGGALTPDHLYAMVDEHERLLAVSRCLVSRGEAPIPGGVAPRGAEVLKPVRGFNE